MEDDRYYVKFSGSITDLRPEDFADRCEGLTVVKNKQPSCPECGSYEVDIERPLWIDREYETAIVYIYCNNCGRWSQKRIEIIFLE